MPAVPCMMCAACLAHRRCRCCSDARQTGSHTLCKPAWAVPPARLTVFFSRALLIALHFPALGSPASSCISRPTGCRTTRALLAAHGTTMVPQAGCGGQWLLASAASRPPGEAQDAPELPTRALRSSGGLIARCSTAHHSSVGVLLQAAELRLLVLPGWGPAGSVMGASPTGRGQQLQCCVALQHLHMRSSIVLLLQARTSCSCCACRAGGSAWHRGRPSCRAWAGHLLLLAVIQWCHAVPAPAAPGCLFAGCMLAEDSTRPAGTCAASRHPRC